MIKTSVWVWRFSFRFCPVRFLIASVGFSLPIAAYAEPLRVLETKNIVKPNPERQKPLVMAEFYYMAPAATLGDIHLTQRFVTDLSTNVTSQAVPAHIPDFFLSLNWNPPTRSDLPSEFGISLGIASAKEISNRTDFFVKGHLLGFQSAEERGNFVVGLEPGFRYWVTRYSGLYLSSKMAFAMEFAAPRGEHRPLSGVGLSTSFNAGLSLGF